jgi:hypothetical protein
MGPYISIKAAYTFLHSFIHTDGCSMLHLLLYQGAAISGIKMRNEGLASQECPAAFGRLNAFGITRCALLLLQNWALA